MLHCLRLIKPNFASNNLNENPNKKFNSFPSSAESFSSKIDYGLQFFTTQRTLLSLSMDMKMSNDLSGWANGGGRKKGGCGKREGLNYTHFMYDDKHEGERWKYQKINDFFTFYCWFLWFSQIYSEVRVMLNQISEDNAVKCSIREINILLLLILSLESIISSL